MKCMVVNLSRVKKIFPIVKITAFLLVLSFVAIFASERIFTSDQYVSAMHQQSEKSLIIIDAGHGGEDPGAIGVDGVYEKDLNLQIAMCLGSMLYEQGYAVLYTRTEDKLLYNDDENVKGIRKISDLKNRCKIAAEYPNAIFISIHMNSYGAAQYSGLQVYYSPQNDASMSLAASIQNAVKNNLQNENLRKIKCGEKIYVLENCENVAVLIECGFLSNAEESKKLSEKEYQKELCSAIICGIIEYREKN